MLQEYILATRPWSFTAAIVPVLVVAAVVKADFMSIEFLRAWIMAVAVQAGANLTNTYYDFVNGVDTADGGEKTLVEKKVSASGLWLFSLACYGVGIAAVAPLFVMSNNNNNIGSSSSSSSSITSSNIVMSLLHDFLPFIEERSLILLAIFITGLLLAFFYTATPIGLKYMALGDVTIFVCFGPLLMQGTCIMLTGASRDDLYLYSVPIGLLTEAILHANNARDIEADAKVKAITVANLIGKKASYYLFAALLFGAYASVAAIGWYHHWGVFASLLTLPLSLKLLENYKNDKMELLPNETAQMHLPFGILMVLGIVFTSQGLFAVTGVSSSVSI